MAEEPKRKSRRTWHPSGKYGRYSTGPENGIATLLWIGLWGVVILVTVYAVLR